MLPYFIHLTIFFRRFSSFHLPNKPIQFLYTYFFLFLFFALFLPFFLLILQSIPSNTSLKFFFHFSIFLSFYPSSFLAFPVHHLSHLLFCSHPLYLLFPGFLFFFSSHNLKYFFFVCLCILSSSFFFHLFNSLHTFTRTFLTLHLFFYHLFFSIFFVSFSLSPVSYPLLF